MNYFEMIQKKIKSLNLFSLKVINKVKTKYKKTS